MDTITTSPAKRLSGEITLPGDKSISHRAIIFGSLASGKVFIEGLCTGEDTYRTIAIFRQLGITIEDAGNRSLTIQGKGLRGVLEPDDILYAGNSGTTIRLLTGFLCAQPFFSTISGDRSLNHRPMKRVVEPLRMMGACISGRQGGNFAPLAIQGTTLHGITYTSPVASAQVKSSLLLAGMYADSPTTVIEPVVSRDHTERLLSFLGAPIQTQGTAVSIQPCERLHPAHLKIPGDISSAAFFIVAALLVPHSEIVVRSVGVNPTRTGCIDILRAMGGSIDLINERRECGEPVADLVVRSSNLTATTISGDVIPRAIDELPVIAIAAACAQGTTVIRDARELRVKESDRIATMTRELKKCGVAVEERDDGMIITGSDRLRGAVCDSHGDHRVAMSLAVAGLCADGDMVIKDCSCIQTSFPEFLQTLNQLKQ